MNATQEKLLDMFQWFKDFCEKENLIYYALGGTALGAVRHSGFIPWDDDIDVGMPRHDYEKMLEAIKDMDKNGKYIIEAPLEKNDSLYPFAKIYDTDTTLIENTRKKTKRGIYIDIFPLDGIGNTEKECKENYKKIGANTNLINTRSCAIRKGRAFYKNVAIILGRMIPEFILNTKDLITETNKLGMERPYNENEYIINIWGAWKEKEITKKEWFGNGKEIDFENVKMRIPENSHEYLKSLYNDYEKLPPKEKQVSHHDYLYVDLEKSYLK